MWSSRGTPVDTARAPSPPRLRGGEGRGEGGCLPRSSNPWREFATPHPYGPSPNPAPASPGEGARLRKSAAGLPRRTLLLALPAALAACGFRPLYGESSGAGALLGNVRVRLQGDGELPFRLREALIENLRPASAAAPLVLEVAARITRDGLLIEDDDEVTRFNLFLRANWAIRRAGEGRETLVLPDDAPGLPGDPPPPVLADRPPLASGEARSIAAYNATASQYATLVSQREVQARAAREVADKIVRRLAAAYEPGWIA